MKSIISGIIGLFSILVVHLKPQDPLLESIKRGSDVYKDFCVSCHMSYGEGVKNVYPPLAKSDFLRENREESIHVIKYGQKGKIVVNNVTYNGSMSAQGLSDDEVADVMNYITNTWGNKNDKMVTEEEVSNIKK
ncbi:cytochrome c [uncultured Algibacter sp.]|uniref:c-type cytochrome n=1 Tax=uncultured Algibacter sp. TaxID=298659 RepID=UPI00263447F3|nr:cytochrome c [uncultured Algibacter sp.]